MKPDQASPLQRVKGILKLFRLLSTSAEWPCGLADAQWHVKVNLTSQILPDLMDAISFLK